MLLLVLFDCLKYHSFTIIPSGSLDRSQSFAQSRSGTQTLKATLMFSSCRLLGAFIANMDKTVTSIFDLRNTDKLSVSIVLSKLLRKNIAFFNFAGAAHIVSYLTFDCPTDLIRVSTGLRRCS